MQDCFNCTKLLHSYHTKLSTSKKKGTSVQHKRAMFATYLFLLNRQLILEFINKKSYWHFQEFHDPSITSKTNETKRFESSLFPQGLVLVFGPCSTAGEG